MCLPKNAVINSDTGKKTVQRHIVFTHKNAVINSFSPA